MDYFINLGAVLKITAFILSSLILLQSVVFSSTAVVEVVSFVEHYQYHKQSDADSFFEFVSLHYGDLKSQHQKSHPEEHQEHQQLPLHNLNSGSVLLLAVTFNSSYDNVIEFTCIDRYVNNFRYTHGSSSFNPLDLLQPPRIA